MSGTPDPDEVLFELQEHILELHRTGQPIDAGELARRFDVDEAEVDACLRAAQVLGSVVDTRPAPPELPAEFELLGELGRGGMGVVYRVHQKPLGRDLALKVLRTADLDDARALSRFEQEARALARLRHPNIVGVHSVGRSGNAIYYTMDLVEGRDLAKILSQGRLTIKKAVHVIRQVADAVAHAHRQNILHRDIKPGNVLVDGDGNAHVVDFGLARDLSTDRSRHTATGQLLGTPGSMSPEQARGDSDAIGPATDVHGLGALLYEMLVGRPPFRADSLHELLRAVVENDPPRADALRRSVPRDLATICEHAMARDSRCRYPSAEAFGDDLRRFHEGESITAQPPGLASRAGRALIRERRLILFVAAAMVLIAVAFFVGSYVDRNGQSLHLAASMRARGEANAALTCVEAAAVNESSAIMQRRMTHALLDCAELDPNSVAAQGRLAQAAKLIKSNYRVAGMIFGFGGRFGRGAATDTLAPYRDRSFVPYAEEIRGMPPWSVLALRQALLAGEVDDVTRMFGQMGMLGPDVDELLDWLAPARDDVDDLAHASALYLSMLGCSFSERGAALDLWPDLVHVRDRLPRAAIELLDRKMRSVDEHWSTSMSPGELMVIPLAILADSPRASMGQRVTAAALIAAAMGCPPAFGNGDQPIAAERTLRAWEAWQTADAGERLQLRNDLSAWLWQRLPKDFAAEAEMVQWFAFASGCPESSRPKALEWWRAHRGEDPRQLLAVGVEQDTNALLDRLGNASGSEVRRLHDLLTLHAGSRSVMWPGGGPAARGSVGDPKRIGLINAWLRAFDRSASRELRLRTALLAFEDGAARPRVVARASLLGQVGDERAIDRTFAGVLREPATRLGEFMRPVTCNWLGVAASGADLLQRTEVTFLPGPNGAVALLEDTTQFGHSTSGWSFDDRDGGLPARLANGDVGALSTFALHWSSNAVQTVELVLMAALEDSAAPDAPWSAHEWAGRLERSLLATPAEASPTRHALRAAAYLPMRSARVVLARAMPDLPLGEDYDFEGDRWLARLLAGESDLEADDTKIRSIGKRWYGAAIWGRLLRSAELESTQDLARKLLRDCDPGDAVARRLLTTLPKQELTAGVRDRLEEATQGGSVAMLKWFGFVILQAFWLFALVGFFRTRPATRERDKARSDLILFMGIASWQTVVIASIAWPVPWLWLGGHAVIFYLGQSERERKSQLVRVSGWVLVLMAIMGFLIGSGWLQAWQPLLALVPNIGVLLGSTMHVSLSYARKPRPRPAG